MAPAGKTKILQIITSLGVGGAERLVLDLMNEFRSDRFEARVAILLDERTALQTYGYPQVPVEVFDMRGPGRLAAVGRLRRFVQGFSPDVIHAHMFHGLAAAALVYGAAPRKAAVCFTSHCYDQAFSPARTAFVKLMRPFRSADIIFHAQQHPQMNARRTVVIGNGVFVPGTPRSRRSWSGADKVQLIFAGRLADQKDPLGLIQSIAALGDPRVHLDIFGAGPLEADCRDLISNLNLADRVRLRGVSGAIREEMGRADIFVMQSKYEGMPMVLLEAGAEALPVMSTPVGAVPSMLANERGLIAQPADFVEALAGAIANPDRALQWGLRFYEHVRDNHSIASTALAHENLYMSLSPKGG